jgi:DNA invertase Pin-like site-specific DNA recombinase
MVKFGVYARVSDDKKKQDGERRQDVERQIVLGKAFWNGRGIKDDEIEVYCDDGKSAFTDDLNQRPNFNRLLNDCRRNVLRDFWVEDMTRFSRNLSMGLQWLKELGNLNVNIVSQREGEIEITSSRGWMQSTMLLMFAEWDSRVKSEKVKSGMQKAKNLGKHTGRPKNEKGGSKTS